MLEELTAASNLLCEALEKYSAGCLAIQRSYARGEKPHTTTPQLPLRMETEAKLAALLAVKLGRAVVAINWSRNQSNVRATINSLPSELLSHIFHLTHSTQPCPKRDYDVGEKRIEPIYPVAFALVCCRWREIVFNTPALWQHVDLSTSTWLNRQRLDSQVRHHLKQAKLLPLYIHVFDSPGYDISVVYPHLVRQWITKLAGRLTSFDLDIKGAFKSGIHDEILLTCFTRCIPGKFTQLTITMQHADDHVFIRGSEDLSPGQSIHMPTHQLEHILSHIKILQLNQLYPQWNSCAFHGLVELRLIGRRTPIAELQLINILRSSPDLRIFQFDLNIQGPLSATSQITPIVMNNLEVLQLVKFRCTQAGTLLRWLAPCPKPLRFAITGGRGLQLKNEKSKRFFCHSCITQFYESELTFLPIIDLLELMPNIQVLAIQGTKLELPSQWKGSGAALERRLEHFYMISCSVYADAILALLNSPSSTIKVVSFYCCALYLGNRWIPEDQMAFHLDELAQNNPEVRFIVQDRKEPNPVESWELFMEHGRT